MTKLVLSLYKYLKKHTKTRYAALILSSAILVFLGLQVEYEEDISKLLPATDSGSERLAFANLRVKDKVFVLFASKDGGSLDQDELVEISDSFTQSLLEKDSSTHYIADVLYKLDEDMLMDAIGYLCENFPIFVDEASYATIDSLLTPENVEAMMESNLETLQSVEGIAMRDMIASDPIGFREIVFSKFNEIKSGMGSNMSMYDGHFFTPDSTIAIAYISPNFKSFDSKSGQLLVELIEKEIELFEADNEELDIMFHGAPVQSVYNARQIKKDLMMTIAISLLISCIFIGYSFKNKSTLPLLVLPVVYGAFFSLTIMYFIRGTMSLMALGIGAIVLGVALSYCLHVITHFKYDLGFNDAENMHHAK